MWQVWRAACASSLKATTCRFVSHPCLPACLVSLPASPPPCLPVPPAGEIGDEWEERRAADAPADDLMALVDLIVPYNMTHNAGAALVGQWGCVAAVGGGQRGQEHTVMWGHSSRE